MESISVRRTDTQVLVNDFIRSVYNWMAIGLALTGFVAYYVSTNETDPTELRKALKSWDLRLNALAKRCDKDQVDLLNRYRHRVELNLQRYMREDAPLADRVTDTLDAASNSPSTEKPEPTP